MFDTRRRSLSEADDRFLEHLAAELTPLLGPRLSLFGLDLDRLADGRIRIRVLVDTSAGRLVIVEEGDSLTDVVANLLQWAPAHRLAEGFREMIEPASV
jgi:hypothetical protein